MEYNKHKKINKIQNNNYIEPFIITKDHPYISSILVSLFYSSHYMNDPLLNSITDNCIITYYQEVLKAYFIDNVRQSKSIMNLNIIYDISKKLSFNPTNNTVINVLNYYTFLIKSLKADLISVNNSFINYIDLVINSNTSIEKNLNTYIYTWLSSNKIVNIPKFIAVYLNKKKNGMKVNIQKRINFVTNYDWVFQSVLCYNEDSNNMYVVYSYNNCYFSYNCTEIPCMVKLDMSDVNIVDRIKLDGFFVIYRLQ